LAFQKNKFNHSSQLWNVKATASCIAYRYEIQLVMIKSFRHKGLKLFFENGSKAGIQAAHATKLARQLVRLNVATCDSDMNLPGWGLHALQGNLQNHWSISVNGNWRMTFTFDGADAVLVDYQDYH
jgi:proteic killer suppression protein